jgi:hypothetical protein
MSRARGRLSWGGGVLVALAAFGCSAPSGDGDLGSQGEAIYGGTVDTTHDAIMALLHVEGNAAGSCTGTTIAKQAGSGVLLTAAHCVVEIDTNDNVVVPVQLVDPAALQVIPGSDWLAGLNAVKTFGVAQVSVHPQYDGSVDSPFDVALVRYLGTTDTTQIIAPLSPVEDKLAAGSTITLYGYGQTEVDQNNTQRRKVDKVIESLTTHQILYDQHDGKGSCRGDSGGPAIVATASGEKVAAVTSFGDQDCTQAGVSVRVSAEASFVESVLAALPAALSCTECRTAAIGPSSPCFSERVACTGNTACSKFYDCISPCKDSACYDACATKNPTGAMANDALATCQCTTACAKECANDTSCGTPTCGGLTVPGALCTSCIQQSCCHESDLCGADASCSSCFGHSGTQCNNNSLYQGLLACLSKCTGDPCKLASPSATGVGGGGADAGSGVSEAGAPLAVSDDGGGIHYQTASTASASSDGGCSCRAAARGDFRGYAAVGWASIAAALTRRRARVRRTRRGTAR